jgi:serine protease Do
MNIHRWHILTLLAGFAWGTLQSPLPGQEQGRGHRFDRDPWRLVVPSGKNEIAVKAAFQEALQRASAATVQVRVNDEAAALGAVVEPDGYLVTKASVLDGEITCRFKDGKVRAARIVGQDDHCDLALLRVDADNLSTVAWRQGGPPPPGSLVATSSPGDEPVAIGVVSTDLRRILGRPEPQRPRGWLGIELGGGESGVGVTSVAPRSAAAAAGLQVGDEIRKVDGTAMQSAAQIVQTIGRHPPGEAVKLLVHRHEADTEVSATLAKTNAFPPEEPEDEWGGGPFSERRSGFPLVLPHDTPLRPVDCGGPLVDTDGRVVGINIARALRVTTYALPASIVREVVSELKRKADSRR